MECPMILWKLYKYILHLITGQSELERICHNYELTGHQRTLLVERSINLSTKLDNIKNVMKSSFDPNDVAIMIAESKKMNQELLAFESTVLPNLISSLETSSKFIEFKVLLKSLRDEQYNVDNEIHEEKLEQLWNGLCPNVRRSARHTSEWGEIGFQGKDPATDFRGMGVLGLDNLVYLATNYQEQVQKMLLCSNTKYKYPFAITGINITGLLMGMLDKGELKNHFYYSGSSIDQFNQLYCQVFIKFNDYYQQNRPENVMQFGTILKEFTIYLKSQLQNAITNQNPRNNNPEYNLEL